MAEEHNYRLVGAGTTTKAADTDLRGKRKDLTNKLKAGNANTRLKTVRTDYKCAYEQKKGADVGGVSSFTVEDQESWEDVSKVASSTADLAKYNTSYTVEQYLNLTENQLAAEKGKQPPAGPMKE